MKKKLVFILILIAIENIFPQMLKKEFNGLSTSQENYFIENKGQWPEDVRFLAKIGGMNAWITNDGTVYDFFEIISGEANSSILNIETREIERNKRGHVVKIGVINANKKVSVRASQPQAFYYNYFYGRDRRKWANYAKLYKEIELENIIDGINVRYYFDGGNLRYDFKIAPGIDLTNLRLKVDGAEGFEVTNEGELKLSTNLGEVRHGKIYSYQIDNGVEKEVGCEFFKTESGEIKIKAEDYNKEAELIIDPLIYSTFIGGVWSDEIYALTIDKYGCAYVTGYTQSSSFPTTPGAYDVSYLYYDAFVSKFNSTGTELEYSSFISGTNLKYDFAYGIAIDSAGHVFITGYTENPDFPTTPGAYSDTLKGSMGVFITKFNSSGTDLIYSTFLGGSNFDRGNAIAVDKYGFAYVTGQAGSTDFPTTEGVYDRTWNGGTDAFITKLDSNGSSLIYSTYVGGGDSEAFNSIAIDSLGYVYVAGYTYSIAFPTTTGAFKRTRSGIQEGVVTKLTPDGTALVYSTYLGGGGNEICYSIDLDKHGYAYVTGITNSTDYHTTPNAYDKTHNGDYDVFITKLNKTGTSLLYSTYVGGSGKDYGMSIKTNSLSDIYITGYTESSNFPTTSGSYDESYNGGSDVFILKFNSSGIAYSSFLGGSNNDNGRGLSIDESNNVYVAGYTNSSDYPTTPGAFDESYNTGVFTTSDGFLTKLYIMPYPNIPLLLSPLNDAIEQPIILTLEWQTAERADKYILQLSNQSDFSNLIISDTGISGLSYNLTDIIIGGQSYFWRVKAKNVGGESEWSDVWKFTTKTPPIQTQLNFPANNSQNHPLTLNLVWNVVYEAEHYQTQLSSDSDFLNMLLDSTEIKGTDLFISDSLENGKNYYWRARGWNIGGFGEWSEVWRFTTKPLPSNPILLKPDSASNRHPLTLELEWIASSDVEIYQLQFSETSDFSSTLIDSNGISDEKFIIIDSLGNDQTYYWRVKAKNIAGESQWSAVWNFTTIPLPKKPILVGPGNDSYDQPANITLIWHSSTDAENYQIQLSNDGDFTEILKDVSTLNDTLIILDVLLDDNKEYYWRVKAHNIGGASDWSEIYKFRTKEKPAIVELLSPADNSENHPLTITLTWKVSERAESYQIQFSDNINFSSTLIDVDGIIDSTFSITDSLENNKSYYWRIKAKNIGGESDWSEIWIFKTKPLPSETFLLYPWNYSENHPLTLTLKWKNSSNAELYDLQLSDIPDFSTFLLEAIDIVDTIFTLTDSLENNKIYYWRIKAKNIGGESQWSEIWQFATIPLPLQPVLLTPLNESQNHPLILSLSWSNSLYAENYDLQFSDSLNFSNALIDSAGIIDTTFIIVDSLANDKTYYWRVKARNIGGESQWSEVWRFTTVKKPSSVKLLLPEDNSMGQLLTPTLIWENALYAESYQLQFSDSLDFSSMILDSTGITDTLFILIDSLANNKTYYWRVKAKNVGGESQWSSVWKFRTIMRLPTIPILLTPVDSSIITIDSAFFAWEESYPDVTSYQFELSTKKEFETHIIDTVITETCITIRKLSDNQRYYWRVRAANEAGCGKYSQVNSLTIKIVGIIDEKSIPKKYLLYPNYPNPFNPTTQIRYDLPYTSKVQLIVYNILGEEVAELSNAIENAGVVEKTFNATGLASGVYIYRLTAESIENKEKYHSVKKLLLIK